MASEVIEFIETTFNNVIKDIQVRPGGTASIILKRVEERDGLNLDREIVVSLPGKNRQEAWRFACIGKILSEIYEAIRAGEVVTKRDIYYRDPELFKSQNFVDRYVDIIAYTCGVTRLDLNVTASPRGIVIGLHQESNDYEIVPDKSVSEIEKDLVNMGRAAHWRWILVIEKESTFKGLAESKFWQGNREIGPGIVVTARGYPDLATRRFLRACANLQVPSESSFFTSDTKAPVFGLFDCDPDGINILDVYRRGSRLLSHEKTYNVPEMIWLGLKPLDAFIALARDAAALSLTERDSAKATAMLKRATGLNEQDHDDGLEKECCSALQWMKMLHRKAEIQILDDRQKGLRGWLNSRILIEMNRKSGA